MIPDEVVDVELNVKSDLKKLGAEKLNEFADNVAELREELDEAKEASQETEAEFSELGDSAEKLFDDAESRSNPFGEFDEGKRSIAEFRQELEKADDDLDNLADVASEMDDVERFANLFDGLDANRFASDVEGANGELRSAVENLQSLEDSSLKRLTGSLDAIEGDASKANAAMSKLNDQFELTKRRQKEIRKEFEHSDSLSIDEPAGLQKHRMKQSLGDSLPPSIGDDIIDIYQDATPDIANQTGSRQRKLNGMPDFSASGKLARSMSEETPFIAELVAEFGGKDTGSRVSPDTVGEIKGAINQFDPDDEKNAVSRFRKMAKRVLATSAQGMRGQSVVSELDEPLLPNATLDQLDKRSNRTEEIENVFGNGVSNTILRQLKDSGFTDMREVLDANQHELANAMMIPPDLSELAKNPYEGTGSNRSKDLPIEEVLDFDSLHDVNGRTVDQFKSATGIKDLEDLMSANPEELVRYFEQQETIPPEMARSLPEKGLENVRGRIMDDLSDYQNIEELIEEQQVQIQTAFTGQLDKFNGMDDPDIQELLDHQLEEYVKGAIGSDDVYQDTVSLADTVRSQLTPTAPEESPMDDVETVFDYTPLLAGGLGQGQRDLPDGVPKGPELFLDRIAKITEENGGPAVMANRLSGDEDEAAADMGEIQSIVGTSLGKIANKKGIFVNGPNGPELVKPGKDQERFDKLLNQKGFGENAEPTRNVSQPIAEMLEGLSLSGNRGEIQDTLSAIQEVDFDETTSGPTEVRDQLLNRRAQQDGFETFNDAVSTKRTSIASSSNRLFDVLQGLDSGSNGRRLMGEVLQNPENNDLLKGIGSDRTGGKSRLDLDQLLFGATSFSNDQQVLDTIEEFNTELQELLGSTENFNEALNSSRANFDDVLGIVRKIAPTGGYGQIQTDEFQQVELAKSITEASPEMMSEGVNEGKAAPERELIRGQLMSRFAKAESDTAKREIAQLFQQFELENVGIEDSLLQRDSFQKSLRKSLTNRFEGESIDGEGTANNISDRVRDLITDQNADEKEISDLLAPGNTVLADIISSATAEEGTPESQEEILEKTEKAIKENLRAEMVNSVPGLATELENSDFDASSFQLETEKGQGETISDVFGRSLGRLNKLDEDMEKVRNRSGVLRGSDKLDEVAQNFSRLAAGIPGTGIDGTVDTVPGGVVGAISRRGSDLDKKFSKGNGGKVDSRSFASISGAIEGAIDFSETIVPNLGANSFSLGPLNISLDNVAERVTSLTTLLGPLIGALGGLTTAAGAAGVALTGFLAAGAVTVLEDMVNSMAGVTDKGEAAEELFSSLRKASLEAIEPLQNATLGGVGSGDAFMDVLAGSLRMLRRLAQGARNLVELDVVADSVDRIATALTTAKGANLNDVLVDSLEKLLPLVTDITVGVINALPSIIGAFTKAANTFGGSLTSLIENVADVMPIILSFGLAFFDTLFLILDLLFQIVAVFEYFVDLVREIPVVGPALATALVMALPAIAGVLGALAGVVTAINGLVGAIFLLSSAMNVLLTVSGAVSSVLGTIGVITSSSFLMGLAQASTAAGTLKVILGGLTTAAGYVISGLAGIASGIAGMISLTGVLIGLLVGLVLAFGDLAVFLATGNSLLEDQIGLWSKLGRIIENAANSIARAHDRMRQFLGLSSGPLIEPSRDPFNAASYSGGPGRSGPGRKQVDRNTGQPASGSMSATPTFILQNDGVIGEQGIEQMVMNALRSQEFLQNATR